MPLTNQIQYYSGNIFDSVPKGTITIETLLHKIKHPKQNMISLFDLIRNEKDKAKRDKLKTNLPAFTPCCFVTPGTSRKYDNIQHFTEVAMLDFDGIPDKDYSNGFKQAIFDTYPHIIASWISASGKGVRALIYIPTVNSPDEFKLYFNAIENEFNQYKGFDTAPKNCILPLFYSIDTNLLMRTNPAKWTKKYIPPKPPPPEHFNSTVDTRKGKWALSNTEKAIDKITDNGHPQLRATAYTLGGYVASGYLSEYEAEKYIHHLIETNSYLKQKASVYKRTATEMIKKGQNEPLHFKQY
jgi:hypothetical protein